MTKQKDKLHLALKKVLGTKIHPEMRATKAKGKLNFLPQPFATSDKSCFSHFVSEHNAIKMIFIPITTQTTRDSKNKFCNETIKGISLMTLSKTLKGLWLGNRKSLQIENV